MILAQKIREIRLTEASNNGFKSFQGCSHFLGNDQNISISGGKELKGGG